MSSDCEYSSGRLPLSPAFLGCDEMPNFDEPPFNINSNCIFEDLANNQLSEIEYGKTYEALIRLNQLQGNFSKDTTPESMAFELHFSYGMSKKEALRIINFFSGRNTEKVWDLSTEERGEYIKICLELIKTKKILKAFCYTFEILENMIEVKDLKSRIYEEARFFKNSFASTKCFEFDGLCRALKNCLEENAISANTFNIVQKEIFEALKTQKDKANPNYLFEPYNVEARFNWLKDKIKFWKNKIKEIEVKLYNLENGTL